MSKGSRAGGLDALRREWTSNVNTFAPCRSGLVQEYVERVLSALESAEVELRALRTALLSTAELPLKAGDDPEAYPCWCRTMHFYQGGEKDHDKHCAPIRAVLGAPERDLNIPGEAR